MSIRNDNGTTIVYYKQAFRTGQYNSMQQCCDSKGKKNKPRHLFLELFIFNNYFMNFYIERVTADCGGLIICRRLMLIQK